MRFSSKDIPMAKLTKVIRSHQFYIPKKCKAVYPSIFRAFNYKSIVQKQNYITVWSSPDYQSKYGNNGAVLLITKNEGSAELDYSHIVLEPKAQDEEIKSILANSKISDELEDLEHDSMEDNKKLFHLCQQEFSFFCKWWKDFVDCGDTRNYEQVAGRSLEVEAYHQINACVRSPQHLARLLSGIPAVWWQHDGFEYDEQHDSFVSFVSQYLSEQDGTLATKKIDFLLEQFAHLIYSEDDFREHLEKHREHLLSATENKPSNEKHWDSRHIGIGASGGIDAADYEEIRKKACDVFSPIERRVLMKNRKHNGFLSNRRFFPKLLDILMLGKETNERTKLTYFFN